MGAGPRQRGLLACRRRRSAGTGAAQGHGRDCSARTSGGGQPAMGDGGACCSQHREERSRESSRGARGPRGRRPTAVGARPGSVGSGLRRKMAEHPEHVGDHGGARRKHDLVVVVVDAGTRRFGRKSSPEVRRKPSCGELRRPICGATSGASKNRLYFWNPRVEAYAGIYIYT